MPITLGLDDHTKRLRVYLNKDYKVCVQLCWAGDVAKALLTWSKKKNIKKDLIWELLPQKSIKFNSLIEYVCSFSKIHTKYIIESLENIRKINLNYFNNDPFLKEKEIKLTKNNIFKYINYNNLSYKNFLKKIILNKY